MFSPQGFFHPRKFIFWSVSCYRVLEGGGSCRVLPTGVALPTASYGRRIKLAPMPKVLVADPEVEVVGVDTRAGGRTHGPVLLLTVPLVHLQRRFVQLDGALVVPLLLQN
eukprot:1180924-Prorocentrum_minimum.AAC.1